MILSRDGWLKRVREVKDLSATRLREGDAILAVVRGVDQGAGGHLLATSAAATSCACNDVPASTGYGEPVQKLFNFSDGERVVGAMVVSPRRRAQGARWPLAVSKGGFGLRFDLDPHRELSHPRRAAASPRWPRATRWSACSRSARSDVLAVVTAGGARAAVQGRRGRRAGRPGPRRHRDQGRRRRRAWSASASARPRQDDDHHRRDRRRQEDRRRPRATTRWSAAAARASPSPSARKHRQGHVGRRRRDGRHLPAAQEAARTRRRPWQRRPTRPTTSRSSRASSRSASGPGMYIGGTDTKGYHHLLWEIVDNSVDEVMNGYASHIEVILHKDQQVGHRHRQRARHPGRHQEAVQQVGARAGADHAARGRQVLVGAVQVLGRSARRRARRWSTRCREELIATVKRDGAEWEQTYERGKPTSQAEEGRRRRAAPAPRIFFRPDPADLRQAGLQRRDRSASGWTPRPSCTRA